MSTNVPATTWQATDGLTEFSNGSIFNIADPSGDTLVDPSGVFIVDTGVIANLIPSTAWAENDAV